MERPVIKRAKHRFTPDRRRVITKPFHPGEATWEGESRIKVIIERILGISDEQVSSLHGNVMAGFSSRHDEFEEILLQNFRHVDHNLDDANEMSNERRLLIGRIQ